MKKYVLVDESLYARFHDGQRTLKAEPDLNPPQPKLKNEQGGDSQDENDEKEEKNINQSVTDTQSDSSASGELRAQADEKKNSHTSEGKGNVFTNPQTRSADDSSPSSEQSERGVDMVEECKACHSSQAPDKGERVESFEPVDDGESVGSDSDEEDYPEIVKRWVYLYDD
jgi:hypothetical protein